MLAFALALLALAGCGGTEAPSHQAALPKASLKGVVPSFDAGSDPPAQDASASVLVATATVVFLPIYATPRALGPAQFLGNPNPLGAPLVLLVNAVQGGWLQVYLPERPNEDLGWVTSTNVSLATDDYHIMVNLGSRQLTLYRSGTQIFQVSVAVGAPDAPTPTGYFYVTEVLKLTDPGDAYGPYALGLSGFSNTYYSFDGGPGQIAIHGTNQPQVIGGYASHGCVRLTNPDITAIASQVPAGTPVDIVA
jgi:lipoprotein-anchoring transpeptidase ErfK/SrfK